MAATRRRDGADPGDIDTAESAGCRTSLLVATEAGRRSTRRSVSRSRPGTASWRRPGLADEPRSAHPTVRGHRSGRHGKLRRRDRRGPDAPAESLRLARDGDLPRPGRRAVGGFVVRAPWGGGSTIATRLEDAEAILHARRVGRGPEHRIRAGLVAENAAGLERLLATGWTDSWRAPRLIRGDPLQWEPEAIWGQFNHALG